MIGDGLGPLLRGPPASVSTPLRFRVPVPAWRGVHCSSAAALPSRLPHDQRWRYSSSYPSSFLKTRWPARRAAQGLYSHRPPATHSGEHSRGPRTKTSVREKPCFAPVSPPHRACSGSYQEGTCFGPRMRSTCVTVNEDSGPCILQDKTAIVSTKPRLLRFLYHLVPVFIEDFLRAKGGTHAEYSSQRTVASSRTPALFLEG